MCEAGNAVCGVVSSDLERFNDVLYFSSVHLRLRLKSVVVLVFLFSSVILLVNSSCSSLKHNHHLINHRIIYKESKYLTELYYFAQERSVSLM